MKRGQGFARSGIVDPFAEQVVLLLRFRETNGATSFSDEAGRTWSAVGAGATADNNSLLLNGSSYIQSTENLSSLAIGSDDYTLEVWANATSLNPPSFYVDLRPTNINGQYPCMYNDAAGNVVYFTSQYVINAGPGSVSAGITHHLCVCRSGTTNRLFVDGVQKAIWSGQSIYLAASSVRVGAGQQIPLYPMPGRCYSVRLTRAARYIAPFTPPTLPLPGI
jgi:hypothetical protein